MILCAFHTIRTESLNLSECSMTNCVITLIKKTLGFCHSSSVLDADSFVRFSFHRDDTEYFDLMLRLLDMSMIIVYSRRS